MAIVMYMRTGHAYRVSDSLTLGAVNDALNSNPDRFVEVPVAPDAAFVAGTPGQGLQVKNLFITPSSVSHFIVV